MKKFYFAFFLIFIIHPECGSSQTCFYFGSSTIGINEFNPVFNTFNFANVTLITKKRAYTVYSKIISKSSATFVFENKKLLSIVCTDNKGKNLLSGDFDNGNGCLILTYENKAQIKACFLNGLLNDSVCYYEYIAGQKRLMQCLIFSSGYLNGFASTFDFEGYLKNEYEIVNHKVIHTKHFGFDSERVIFHKDKLYSEDFSTGDKTSKQIFYYPDGKIRQVNFYENNKMIKTILYKPDGTIDKK
jgi:antitoxin component YwqK of YwqJK toxin-antitoxin module